jgi:thiol:disulfide interchange protein DsbD
LRLALASLTALLFLHAVSDSARAQFENPIRFSAKAEPVEARHGETVALTITATIKQGWHLYALPWATTDEGPIPTTLTFDLPSGLRLQGSLQQSQPKSAHDPNFDMQVQWFAETARFTQKFRVDDNHALGAASVAASVKYQACTDEVCLPPRTEKLVAQITVVEGAARPQFISTEPVTAAPPKSSRPAQVQTQSFDGSKDIWGFLLLALGAGFLSIFTPCVFPMIPLTVSFFTNQAENKNNRPVALAFTYCVGIIVMFTALGLLLTVLLGPGGPTRLAANPFMNTLIALLLVAFSLSLFGLFDFQLPSGIANFLNRKSTATGGYLGAVLMGFTFTLLAFACTAPFMGTVLVSAATGERLWPTIGMLAYSTALASPFFFLALFPRLLAKMPRSGGWLNSVKVVMGFIVLAAAFKFISVPDVLWHWDVFTRPVMLAGWTAIALFAGLYLLGIIRFPHDTKLESIGPARMLISLVCVALSFYLGSGLFGQKLHPLVEVYLHSKTPDKLTWLDNLADAKAQSTATGRPIFVDFTGYTCTNCRWMEQNVFSRPEVENALQKFVRLRLYTDGGKDWQSHQSYQIQKFGTPALPFYAIIDANENVLATRGGITRDPKHFLALLEKGLESKSADRAVR